MNISKLLKVLSKETLNFLKTLWLKRHKKQTQEIPIISSLFWFPLKKPSNNIWNMFSNFPHLHMKSIDLNNLCSPNSTFCRRLSSKLIVFTIIQAVRKNVLIFFLCFSLLKTVLMYWKFGWSFRLSVDFFFKRCGIETGKFWTRF